MCMCTFIYSIRIQRLTITSLTLFMTQFPRGHHNQTYYRPTQVIKDGKLWFQETRYTYVNHEHITPICMKIYPLPSSCCESTICIHLSAWQTELRGYQKTHPNHQVPITQKKRSMFHQLKLDPCWFLSQTKGKSPQFVLKNKPMGTFDVPFLLKHPVPPFEADLGSAGQPLRKPHEFYNTAKTQMSEAFL